MKTYVIITMLLIFCMGCQISHPATMMVNPSTGDKVLISNHGTTGKIGSALAARWATERDIEELKKKGYEEVK
jgi:hypothetical protein